TARSEVSAAPASRDAHPPRLDHRVAAQAAKLESKGLAFVENAGQFDTKVKFQVSNHGKTLWLTNNGITFDFVQNKSTSHRSSPSRLNPSGPAMTPSGTADPLRDKRPSLEAMNRQVISQEFVGTNRDFAIDAKGVQQGTY